MEAGLSGGYRLGAWFTNLVAPALDGFADPTVGPLLALIIFSVGAIVALGFVSWVYWIERSLARPTKVLRSINGPAAFEQRFAEIDAALTREPLLKHGWDELKDSFVELPGPRRVIRNTVRPGRYINRHESNLDRRWVQSLPNIFVGIGLLCTFIGLVAALKAANSGMAGALTLTAAERVAATTNSLVGLLGAATAKFYTSIAGLGCSIVLGIVIRGGFSRIDHRFKVLEQLLEKGMKLVTPEELSARLVDEAAQQTTQLKHLNTEIAVTIGRQLREAIDDTLPKHLSAVASPLTERVGAMMELVTNQSREGVGEMIRAFGDRLEGSTESRMREIGDTLGRLDAALGRTAQQMAEGGGGLGEALRGAAGQLAATVEAVRDTVAGLAQRMRSESEAGQERMRTQIEEVHQAVSLMTSRLVRMIEEGASLAREGAGQASSVLVGQVTAAAERLAAAAGGIEAAIGQASERAQTAVQDTAADTARHLGEAGAGAMEQLRRAVGEAGSHLAAMGQELARTTQAMRELEARIAGHARAIGEAEGGTKAVVGALGETAIRIKDAANEASAGLRGATQPLVAVSGQLAGAAEATRRSNEGLERVLGTTAEQARRQAEAAERALTELERVWQRHAARFDGVDEELGRAFETIGQKLHENLSHLARFTSEIDRHATSAVDRFAGAIEELGEVGESIEKAVKDLNGHFDGGPGRGR